jgi:hypothetical protein
MAWAHLTFYLLATLLVVLVLTLKDEWSVDPRNVIQASPAALVEKSAVPKPSTRSSTPSTCSLSG